MIQEMTFIITVINFNSIYPFDGRSLCGIGLVEHGLMAVEMSLEGRFSGQFSVAFCLTNSLLMAIFIISQRHVKC